MKNSPVKRLLALAVCMCMLLGMYVPFAGAETVSYHDMSISQLLDLDEDLTWVFTGDSITHNGGWTGGYNDYAAWFEQYLYDIGRGGDTLINTAWGGAAIQHFQPTYSGADGQGLEQFVTKYDPDVVFIKLGMNNRTMTDAEFARQYNIMLDGIYEAGAQNGKVPKVILLAPTPLSGESGISSGEFGSDPISENYVDSTRRFAINLSNIASERGLEFVDLRQAMVDESAVLGDRYHHTFFSDPSDGLIHPNGAGQYFMFTTICKDLGLYDSAMPIFKVSYDDIINAPLYGSNTNIGYTGSYGIDHSAAANAAEMNKTMPQLDIQQVENNGPKLLAAIDFDATNGTFVGGNTYEGATRVDLTDAAVMDDALTLEEVQSLEREYTLVLRARLDLSNQANQPVLWIANDNATWNGALALGVQGKSDQIYYNVRKGTATNLNVGGGTYTIDAKVTASNGGWHTIAYVQKTTGLEYYVDGVLVNTLAYYVKDGATIGEIFSSTTNLTAHIGSYGTHAKTYELDGDLDYYQLYKGTLTADEIKHLSDNDGVSVDDAAEMNKTMPNVISDATPLASVDFSSTTGNFPYAESYGKAKLVDLTDENAVDDPLTLEEAQALNREFSIVLRAKLDSGSYRPHQALLMLSPDANSVNWNNAISVGGPGTGHNFYYEVRQGGAEKTNSPNTIALKNTPTTNVRNNWHTIALVQRTDGLDYYIDGVLAESWTYKLNDGVTLGSVFADATDIMAHIGGFARDSAGTYCLKANLDYYQLYGAALTAAQVASLGNGSDTAAQMNCTMPALPQPEQSPELLASVDFDSTTGIFAGTSNYATSTRWDLTDASKMTDALTLEEVQGLDREFSIVLRGKLDSTTHQAHQALLMLTPGGDSDWNNAISVGGPGKSNNLYYEVRQAGKESTNTNPNIIALAATTANVTDAWHTIAIVQRTDGLDYYIDGELAETKAYYLNNGVTLGSVFADATEFTAHVGSFAVNSAGTYNLKADLDFYQIYGGALSAAEVKTLSATTSDTTTVETAQWTDTVVANNLWAVVGADQLSGYLGQTPNFSLFRLLNNGMRGGANATYSYRDIRMMNLAKPGQTVAQYDAALSGRQYDVLMLLPELPEIHAADYVHSADKVAAYKANLLALIEKNAGKSIVLWTPLASPDATINGYINDYAAAVRQIAADPAILFFDANLFMNERMSTVGTNWFDDSMHISPLCATDLAYAFFVHADYPYSDGKDPTYKSELKDHNLRNSSDKRLFKSGVIKENLSYTVSVSGGSLTVDASEIAALGYTKLQVAVIPALGIGSVVEPWILGNAGQSLAAPHSNPAITVYGEKDGVTYRFKDVQVTLTTDKNLTEPYFETDDLTALEVVGAPAIGFDPAKTTYDVELYQYQRQVRIVAKGGSNLTIQVNGQTVKSGDFSQYIAVEDTATVTVTVTGGAADKIYTLNLSKPAYADIIITEVMSDGYDGYHQKGADNYELIEIYNASGKDLNLLDYSIGYIREYPYAKDAVEDGEIPYYFTGNDHNFFGNSYLGINQITKYSSYWTDKVDQEPEEVIFPADSTMVIWVKFSKDAGTDYGSSLTYDTLISALEAHSGTHTLTVEVEENGETVTKTIVPTQDQLVVAEIPYGAAQSNVTQNITTTATNFYMDGFQVQQDYNNRRGWLFVLDDSAVRDNYGALTEAGDDIISAAKYVRPGYTHKLSSVMYYDVTRGMSVVKNPGYWDTNYSTGHTSDQQGYANKTSFGAVEYWQKPYDLADTTLAVIANNTPAVAVKDNDVTIALSITDDQDIRYVELYVDADNDGTYETVIKKDITLITSASNAGKAADVKSYELNYTVTNVQNAVNYYGFVLDGNNNKTELAPTTISFVTECEHSWSEGVVTDPTCTEDGYTTYTCSVCGQTKIDNIVSASGEHNYGEGVVTKAPTCAEDGEMTYTCADCGKSYTEAIDATGEHSYDDTGVCTVCGESKANLVVKSWNIVLGDDIGLNFVLDLTQDDEVQVNVDGKEVPAELIQNEDGTYQVFVEVAAAQMTAEIQIVVNGQAVEKTYSVREYADVILAGDYKAEIKALVNNMLVYGGAAQNYFGVNTDDLANKDITVSEVTVPGDLTVQIQDELAVIDCYGVSLVLRSKTAVRFYFIAESVDGLTFTVNGNDYTPVSANGKYYVEVADINPQALADELSMVVSDGTNSLTVSYSPVTYISRMYHKADASEQLKAVVKAMYGYHLAAKAYIESTNV